MKDFRRKAAPKRTKTVIFRLTDDEYEQLLFEAHKLGLTVNELARSFARTPQGRLTIETTEKVDPAYLAELKRIGNNLNQLAKHANLYGEMPGGLEVLCGEIRTLIVERVME